MLESLPIFNYNTIKSKINYGIRTTQKRFYPVGKNNFTVGIIPDSYVKFQIFENGFWDPKTAYLHIEVQPNNYNPLNGLSNSTTIWQLDNSAQSLFSQLIIRHNGTEIERILEYDSLAAMLYDMNIGLVERESLEIQGIGKSRSPINPVYNNRTGMSLTTNLVNSTTTVDPFPWLLPTTSISYAYNFAWYNWGTGTGSTPAYGLYPAITQTVAGPESDGSTAKNLTSVCCGLTSTGWRPYLSTQPPLRNTDLVGLNAALGTAPQPSAQISSVFEQFMFNDGEGAQLTYLGNTQALNGVWCGFRSQYVTDMGFDKPYSDASVGGNEAWMSDGYLAKYSNNAGISSLRRPDSLQFCIPLLSPLFGILSTHKKLLPLSLFQGLEFEFLINKYAFHAHSCPSYFIHGDQYSYTQTGGLWDTTHNFSDVLGNRIGWNISRIELVVDVINLEDQTERNIVDRVLINGFNLSFSTWYMCLKKSANSNVECNTTLSINHAFDSMKMVSLRATSNLHESYSIYRKHHYLSLNLTSIQLKVGNEFIPSNPIIGHTGFIRNESINAATSNTLRSCYIDFYIQTMKAWGKFFDLNNKTLLNATNFTINQLPFVVPTTNFSTTSTIISSETNNDLGYGQTLFNVNRYIGRCIISIDTERFDTLPEVLSGLDTTQYKPWDIIVSCDTNSVKLLASYTPIIKTAISADNNPSWGTGIVFTEPNAYFNTKIYIYVWVYYDAMLTFNPSEGWKVLGRY